MAEERLPDVHWEAPEHYHSEKGSDWYWAVGIVAAAGVVAAIAFGNILFGIVILLGAAAFILGAAREPRTISYVVSARGIRIGNESLPYNTLESFNLDEEDPRGPQLLLKSERFLSPLIVIPIPEDAVDDIEHMLEERLPEEHLEEPLGHRVMEFFGF